MSKVKCALIGSGNIGTDLLYKLKRSEVLEPVWMVGIDPESEGLARAKEMGLKTTADGVDGLLPHVIADGVQVAFDATSAYVHKMHVQKLEGKPVVIVDLTPAAVGPFCIPSVNLRDFFGTDVRNVNMVSCGAQATVPMVHAVSRVQEVEYGEIVATVASKSIGPGTRTQPACSRSGALASSMSAHKLHSTVPSEVIEHDDSGRADSREAPMSKDEREWAGLRPRLRGLRVGEPAERRPRVPGAAIGRRAEAWGRVRLLH